MTAHNQHLAATMHLQTKCVSTVARVTVFMSALHDACRTGGTGLGGWDHSNSDKHRVL